MLEDVFVEALSVNFYFVRHNCNHLLLVEIEKVYDLFFDLQLTQIT